MPPSTANVCRTAILILTFSLGFNSNLAAAEPKPSDEEPTEASGSLFEALTSGRFKALLRYSAQRRNSNLHMLQDGSEPIPPTEKLQYYSAVGGYLGYQTADWFNTSVGATIYTSQPLFHNPDNRRGLGGLYEADGGQDSYTVLGELFVRYQHGAHLLKAGLIYQGENFTTEAWNYYVNDFVNTFYLYGDYRIRPVSSDFTYAVAVQYTNQQDVGDHIAGNIDTYHWGLRLSAQNDKPMPGRTGPKQRLTFGTLLHGRRASEFSPKWRG